MRCVTSPWLAAAIAAVGLGLSGPPVSACDTRCGSRYAPTLYGPPVDVGSAVVYSGAPVYGAAAAAYAYGPTYYDGYYRARAGILRGPQWDYSAAYYTWPPACRGFRSRTAHRVYRPYAACMRGPVIRMPRRR
jgi:hypothetical protein